MAKILVVDDMAVYREPISMALESRGHSVVCASNGQEALAHLDSHRPDLVILDVVMPIMDGVTFLRRLRERPEARQPAVILLTAVADRDRVVEAGRLGVRHYLLKSQFSLQSLFDRVEQALNSTNAKPEVAQQQEPSSSASSNEPVIVDRTRSIDELKRTAPLLTKSTILERLEVAADLQAMSPVVTRLLKLTGSKEVSVQNVAKTIKQDQALAVKILKLANSSIYTRGEPVELVDKAVLRIGLEQIRQVLLNITVVDNFGGDEGECGIRPGPFWEHSIGCGLIAAEIAHLSESDTQDQLFTTGLVHDVGRMLLISVLGDEYNRIVETAERLQLPLETAESRLLGVNHADVMDRILHRWHFPRDLIDPIVFHHLSIENARHIAPRKAQEISTLSLADRLCHALMLGSSGNDTLYPTESYCEALRIPEEFFDRIAATIPEQTCDLRLAMMAHSSPSTWRDTEAEIREQLPESFRPLYVSSRPAHDAFHLFFQRLATPSEESPTIGVVHIRSRSEVDEVLNEYGRQEESIGVRLPLLVICSGGVYRLPTAVTADRECVLLQSPLPVRQCIQTITGLLGGVESSRVAA